MALVAQGTTANLTGNQLERFVERLAVDYGYLVVPYIDDNGNVDMFNELVLLKNVPYTSIYGTTARSEYVLSDTVQKRRIRLECRWQEVKGSCDEKLPYLYLNAAQRMPESEIILLIDGDGARESAVSTIRKWAEQRTFIRDQRTILVQNMAEFQVWFRKFQRAAA